MVSAGYPLRDSVYTQPFINYNIPKGQGWYLVSAPIITVDWNAAPGRQWTVPLGGGFGRVFKVAGQAFNAQVEAFYNVVRAGPGVLVRQETDSSASRLPFCSQSFDLYGGERIY